MIKETDGDRFEEMRSLEQSLTFEKAGQEFKDRNIRLGKAQMKTLGIMTRDGVYTNLGLLLSDQCVHTVNAAVFEGANRNQFKDWKEFTGSLFRQMEDGYDFIDFHNQTHSFYDKLRRIDRRDYPEAAVRESLLNLLIHREYSYRASSFISIYTDRIEFTSLGGLVSGVTLKDVMMGISVCRNAKLADVFYRLELIEAYGSGIRKIMDAYEGSGRMPRIETSDNAFKIILPNRNAEPELEEAEKTGFDGVAEVEKEKESVIELAKEHGFVTRKEVEALLGVSQTTCGCLLRQMTENGLLFREGKGKRTRYCLP